MVHLIIYRWRFTVAIKNGNFPVGYLEFPGNDDLAEPMISGCYGCHPPMLWSGRSKPRAARERRPASAGPHDRHAGRGAATEGGQVGANFVPTNRYKMIMILVPGSSNSQLLFKDYFWEFLVRDPILPNFALASPNFPKTTSFCVYGRDVGCMLVFAALSYLMLAVAVP